jgi:uncharacterized protein YegP (UPF0339 family)
LRSTKNKTKESKNGHIRFSQTNRQFYWKLNAANVEKLCVSEGYTTKQNAINGIESCQRNAPDAEIDYQTTD